MYTKLFLHPLPLLSVFQLYLTFWTFQNLSNLPLNVHRLSFDYNIFCWMFQSSSLRLKKTIRTICNTSALNTITTIEHNRFYRWCKKLCIISHNIKYFYCAITHSDMQRDQWCIMHHLFTVVNGKKQDHFYHWWRIKIFIINTWNFIVRCVPSRMVNAVHWETQMRIRGFFLTRYAYVLLTYF